MSAHICPHIRSGVCVVQSRRRCVEDDVANDAKYPTGIYENINAGG